jgi:exodeoxyribonuclease VII large subunit
MSEFMPDPSSQVYTPSELNREAKLHLEAGFPRLLLEAEISNLSRPASGHLYFSLKDEKAQIRCAMFRSAAARSSIALENGKKVIARGRISLYEARGEYQFIVDAMREAGEGELQQQFEKLKKKLEAEGLFKPEAKKALPEFPQSIGVITSRSGAALKDILQVLQRRWPIAKVLLYPVAVQGVDAPAEILSALAKANRDQQAEVLILGRGGGSLEDLQAFNDEAVARGVAASEIPLISAVGHETDFSICDFVADLRAPTPSAAAELATPDSVQLSNGLQRSLRLLEQRIRGRVQKEMQGLDYLSHRLSQRDPAVQLLEQNRQVSRLDESLKRSVRQKLQQNSLLLGNLSDRLQLQHPAKILQEHQARLKVQQESSQRLLQQILQTSNKRLHELGRTLHAVSPLATLGRGYAVLSKATEKEIITSAKQAASGQKLKAQLADGRLYCTVDEVTDESLESGD